MTIEATTPAASRLVFPAAQTDYTAWRGAAVAAGWEVSFYPTFMTASLDTHTWLDQALAAIRQAHDAHILLASPAAAGALLAALPHLEEDATAIVGSQLLLLGLATQHTIDQLEPRYHRFFADAPRYSALADAPGALSLAIPTPHNLILPIAKEAHDPLPPELERLGYTVEPVPAYVRFSETGGDPVGQWLFQGKVDAIFFPSPDHLRFFRRRLLAEGGSMSMLDHVETYCIDEWTATVARQFGLTVHHTFNTLDPDEIESILHRKSGKIAGNGANVV